MCCLHIVIKKKKKELSCSKEWKAICLNAYKLVEILERSSEAALRKSTYIWQLCSITRTYKCLELQSFFQKSVTELYNFPLSSNLSGRTLSVWCSKQRCHHILRTDIHWSCLPTSWQILAKPAIFCIFSVALKALCPIGNRNICGLNLIRSNAHCTQCEKAMAGFYLEIKWLSWNTLYSVSPCVWPRRTL